MNMLRKLSSLRYSVELISINQKQQYFSAFVQHIFISTSKEDDNSELHDKLVDWLNTKLQVDDIMLIYGSTKDNNSNYYEVITTGYLRKKNIYYLTSGDNKFIHPFTKYTHYKNIQDLDLANDMDEIVLSLCCLFIQSPSIPNSSLYMQDNVQFDGIYLPK